ncbi:5'-3' exoribonuclease 1 [Thelohanellus kitauei]|uniref:5'-3' exoribonuclease 1 n=1 Tax=Thelohanellus kitauei TaxID=669202 RepID=A0A0C2N527_THEKT|nr:5'-3' exoribonuclease 1 [Thelohanellus kitauei]
MVFWNIIGYLVEDFSINLKRFKIFLAHLSNYEIKHFRDSQANEVWLSGKKNRKTTSIHQHSTSFIYSANDDLNQVIHEDVSIDINIGNDEIFTPSTFGPSFQSTTPDLFDQDDQEIAEISEQEKTQFESFKGDYYKSKLKNHFDTYANDICMEYIRGLEWTIRYYFKGTPSWMWLFPYHYAPFASDLANNMPDSIEFDLGEPCSPFVQLACIMPKESFNLLPRKIQTFFDNPNHQLIDMFPTKFESDKLGKAQEYESVVLIPFPDISRIKPIVEEIMLESDQTSSNVNSFGDSFLYEYVPEICSTLMLPPDESQQDSHVIGILLVKKEKFPSTPHPSFAPLPHDTTLRVFNINNSLQISAETVINQPKPVELNVMKLITYPFCGNYPFSNLYFSTEFYDLEYRYRIRKRSRNHELVCRIEREKLTQDEISNIMEICQDYQQRYYNDYRITIPKISYLINVKPFVGFKYSMAARNCSVKYVWSEESLFMPFEICYPIDPKFRLSSASKLDVKQIYQPGDLVLSTDSENFGFISKIKSIDVGSSTAEIEMCCEPHFDLSNVGFIQKSMYYSFYDSITSCKMLGINKMVFGRVAGSILVRKHHEGRVFADIGLKLKSKSFDMEVIGYTKISNNYYFFSEEALLLIKEYLTRFTHLYTLLVHFPVGCDSITLELLESGQDDCLLDTIQTWLADNKVGKLVRVFGGCHYIDTPSTQELLTLPKKVKTYKTITQPLKDLISLNPIFTSTHLATDPKNLLDFVICTHLDDTSPYLQTGIVTGVFSTYGPQSMPIYYCEVMFMEENSVGTLHRGGSSRLACVPSDSIINISSRRSNFPKFVPNKWKHTLFTGNFTPSMEFKEIFRIKTTFIPSDISLEPSHQFEQLIKNLSFHRETVPTRISQQNVEINVHTNSEILIRLLEDLCQSMVDSELSFAMKKFQHKHLCVVNVGKRSFYGSWSSTEEMAKLNSCYVAYYSLLSQIDNPQPDYQR